MWIYMFKHFRPHGTDGRPSAAAAAVAGLPEPEAGFRWLNYNYNLQHQGYYLSRKSVCGPEITIFCIFIRWERFLEFSKLTAAQSKGPVAEEQELFLCSSFIKH